MLVIGEVGLVELEDGLLLLSLLFLRFPLWGFGGELVDISLPGGWMPREPALRRAAEKQVISIGSEMIGARVATQDDSSTP